MKPLVVFAALAFLVQTAHADDDVADLVQRADMAYRGDTSAGVFDMTVKTSSFTRSYKVVVWGDDRDDKEHALVKILGPALWRGFGTLKVGDNLKLYDPKTNHVTVVSSSMLGDSWMGSHFSNDDLVKETQLAKHYKVKLLKKWTDESGLGADSTFYRISLTPKPSAPVAWARIVYTVAEKGDELIPTKAEYYRKKKHKKPSRTMTFTDVSKLGGKRLPAVMKMTVASKPGEYTLIKYKKLKLGVKIPKGKFTEQALKK
jgi:outer membrane lipoprotein-sorting protein